MSTVRLNQNTGLPVGLGIPSPIINWAEGGKQEMGPYSPIWRGKDKMPGRIRKWVKEYLNENYKIDPGTTRGTAAPGYKTWAQKNAGKGPYKKPVWRPGQ